MQFGKKNFLDYEILVARTGYTGEDGFEIFLPIEVIEKFARLLSSHEPKEFSWIGLAARDSLRLEAGFCLHGHEISEEISPLEARLSWAVSFKKEILLGRNF